MTPEQLSKSEETRKQLDVLLTVSLTRLAILLDVTMTEERLRLYLEPLSDLTAIEIERGFKTAAKHFKSHTRKFPTPGELIEFSQGQNTRSGFIDDAGKYLSEKRPDKTPMTAEEARSLLAELRTSMENDKKS